MFQYLPFQKDLQFDSYHIEKMQKKNCDHLMIVTIEIQQENETTSFYFVSKFEFREKKTETIFGHLSEMT